MADFFALIGIYVYDFYFHYGHIVGNIIIAVIVAYVALLFVNAFSRRKPDNRRYRHPEADPLLSARSAAHLSDAVKCETVTGNVLEFAALHRVLQSSYPAVFSACEVDKIGRGSLLIRWKGKSLKENPVLFTGHLDVTLPADEAEWKFPPFSGEVADKKIWGRGTADGKCSAIALLDAAEELINSGFVPDRDVYFAFGHDKNTGGFGGAGKISEIFHKKGLVFDTVIDSESRIYNGFMGKPSSVAAEIGIAENGSCTFVIATETPEGAEYDGEQALKVLNRAVGRVKAYKFKPRGSRVAKSFFTDSSYLMPTGRKFICANLSLLGRFGAFLLSRYHNCTAYFATTSDAVIAKEPGEDGGEGEKWQVNVTVSLLYGDTVRSVHDTLGALVGDLPCRVFYTSGEREPSDLADVRADRYAQLEAQIKETFGDIPVFPTMLTHATDGYHYEKVCDRVYRFAPFVVPEERRTSFAFKDENITAESMGKAVEFYISFIKRISGSGESDKLA